MHVRFDSAIALVVMLILAVSSSVSFGCENWPLFLITDLDGKVIIDSNNGLWAPDQKMWTFNALDDKSHRSFKASEVHVTSIDGNLYISSDGKLFIEPSALDMKGRQKYQNQHMPFDTKFGIYHLNEETLQYVADELGYGCGGTSISQMRKRHPDW